MAWSVTPKRTNRVPFSTVLSLHQNEEIVGSVSRRQVVSTAVGSILSSSSLFLPWISGAAEEIPVLYDYENRDRKSNRDALIREDYWFMMGKTPPRLLTGPIKQDDPQWNAFGSCSTQEGDGAASNSCTYVSLKQRVPIYSKYGFSIALGAKEYAVLGELLRKASRESKANDASNASSLLKEASSYVTTPPQQSPPPPVDALLKMVLFASGMLTSPNYNGPNKRLLVARYYANEAGFAVREVSDAIMQQDTSRAIAAWEYGRDSWNSYFQIVNEAVTPKVGDKFDLIV
ncbi:hypothetical protein IV203_036872 [Nitzschia inconspicua]|uniref:Uncharacterized protein n=1 Tax=Nitzschia inconspicua TaxID=303405 RepID=A0A9K3LIV8_9STRA|nr:hypothetical protein IV203_036872 [Nitzschia inconspicua]